MAHITDYKQELIEKVRENYLSVALGVLVFLVIMTLIFRSGETPKKDDMNKNAQDTKQKTYVVKPGDSVSSIARDQLGSMDKAEAIIKANNLKNPNTIEVGTELVLPNEQVDMTDDVKMVDEDKDADKQPDDDATVNGDGEMSDKTKAITGDTYTVVKGDHLWDIAVRAYGDGNKYTMIIEANKLRNPDRIEAGTVLKLPRAK